ncbi:hypothetical protein [Helicobacter cinaedi]|uniref:hypothetical protein n=1 Tax=Helicobacter cinaedi TaxID=213 RepID=UPI003C6D92F0
MPILARFLSSPFSTAISQICGALSGVAALSSTAFATSKYVIFFCIFILFLSLYPNTLLKIESTFFV